MILLQIACAPIQPDIDGVGDTATDDTNEVIDTAETGDTAETAESDTGDCADIPKDEAGYVRFYDATLMHRIAITLSDASMNALVASPDDYVEAELVVDDVVLPSVGVKWRGDTAWQRWDGKPGFKLDIRQYNDCNAFASIQHIVLDAGTDDPAQVREVVSAAALTQLGVIAPLASYATVTVNGENFGLYTNVEAVDDDFPAHHTPEPWISLWEGGDDADFTARGLADWSVIDGLEDPAVLEALSTVVLTGGDQFYAEASALADMDQLVHTWAALTLIGHAKAYPYRPGDVYLYAPNSDGRLRFIPWNLDEGWDPTFRWNGVEGALGLRCVYDTTCEAALRAAIEATLAEPVNLSSLASAAYAISAEAVAADPRRGTTSGEVQQARNALLTTMAGWPATIRGQLAE